MRNIKLLLQYDGTDFSGWQYQPGRRTVQGTLEGALRKILKEDVKVIGAGRTDAGVHAMGQVANFKTHCQIPVPNLKRALNSVLPPDIRILEVEEVPTDFHARYSAKAKVYQYRILQRPDPDVFLRRYVWHVPFELRRDFLCASIELLRGEHDFSSFRSTGSSTKTSVRIVYEAEVRFKDGLYTFYFRANGFLRHMVRNIVGTLVEMSLKDKTVEDFHSILKQKDRTQAGPKAPPQGLFLVNVIY